jgi:molybdenum cofactor biosynthesis protein MoaC
MGEPLPIFAFEDDDPGLRFMPLAARRALDLVGRRLSLDGWRSLVTEDRLAIARAGLEDRIDSATVLDALSRSRLAPAEIEPSPDPPREEVPESLASRLGSGRPLERAAWAKLRAIDRFALVHAARRAAERGDEARLAVAYDAIVAPALAPALSHLGPGGDARMVDVSAKPLTRRRAVATGKVTMLPETARMAKAASGPKGEVIGTARLAGIMAAKRTPELIPLCHTVALSRVDVHIDLDDARGEARVQAVAEAVDRTGVEMEALVAASIACLTIYDMLKAVDREMVVTEVSLAEKTGGKLDYARKGR